MAQLLIAGAGTALFGSAQVAGASFGTLALIAIGTSALSVGAGYLDSRYIYPALFGEDNPRNPNLVAGIDQMTGADGSPGNNVWGRAALVGGHVLFFENVEEQGNRPNTKKGPSLPMTRRLADVGIAWAKTQIQTVERVFGDQKPYWERDANQADWADYRVSIGASAGNLVLLAQLDEVPDFDPTFEAGCIVLLQGVLGVGFGPSALNGYWRVVSVAGAAAGATLSTITLSPLQSQTAAIGIAGSATSPMTLKRIDFGVMDHLVTYLSTSGGLRLGIAFNGPNAGSVTNYLVDPAPWWRVGRKVRFEGYTPASVNGDYFIDQVVAAGIGPGNTQLQYIFRREDAGTPALPTGVSATNPGRIVFRDPFGFRDFSEGQDMLNYVGNETDGPDPTLAGVYGAPNVHGYRGTARSTVLNYNFSNWGDRVAEHSAVLRVNAQHSTLHPIRELIAEAFDGDTSRVDLTDVVPAPLLGFTRRGQQPTSSTLQPLCLAYGIECQEVGRKFRFFSASKAHLHVLGEDDFGAYVGRRNRPRSPFRYRRTPDRLLPRRLSMFYRSPLADYARKEAIARAEAPAVRTTDNSVVDVDPVVMWPWDADREVRRIFVQSLAAADQGTITLPPSLCYVLTNDRMTFDAMTTSSEEIDTSSGSVSYTTKVRPIEEGSATLEVSFAGAGNCRLVDRGNGEWEGLPAGLGIITNSIDYETGEIELDADESILSAVVSYEFENNWRMRVQRTHGRGFLTECELVGVAEKFPHVGSPSQFNWPAYQPTIQTEPIRFEVLDVPAIGMHAYGAWTRGLLVAACPMQGGSWQGGLLYTSPDGATWTPRGFIQAPTPIGSATTALGPGLSTSTWDYSETLTVAMEYGEPVDATLSEIDELKNWCAVGNEIIAFRHALDNGDGTYTLSGLLRGLRNTEEYIGTHAIGDRVVLLAGVGDGEFSGGPVPASGLWDDWTASGSGNGALLLNAAHFYKVVPSGGIVNSIEYPAQQLTITGRFRRPFSVEKLIQATGLQATDADSTAWTTHPALYYNPAAWLTTDVVVQWRRRHRAPWDWNPPSPMWELYERYRITVKRNGNVVDVRHLGDPIVGSAVTECIFRYTLTEQTAAGFVSADTAEIVVEQQGMFEYSPPTSITWTIP